VPMLLGDPILDSAKRSVEVPVLGTVNVTSVLAFDTGVYLVVLGVVLATIVAFGTDPVAPVPDPEEPA
jgi:multicomponent Na+:H+ antiporter subunit B